jgi:hypothetical protein
MKQNRLPRRQRAELQRIYAAMFADSLEYCDEHIIFIRRRQQSYFAF